MSVVILLLSAASIVAAQQTKGETSEREKALLQNSTGEKTFTHASDKTLSNQTVRKNEPNQYRQNGYVRPDGKTRFKRYVNSVIGPVSLAKNIAGAGFSTWRNSPEEWGDKWEGFGRRVASNFGKSAIKNTTRFALEETFKLDSRFYRSQKRDFASRLGNALISPVTARDENGKRVFGFPRIVGTYTGSIIAAETWYPNRYDYKNGLRSGTISLGVNAAVNVFKEFVLKK